ncbi:MAG: hypothetical protein MJZ81_07175 [Bacteroidales bacterium]|nr:hypothetical protein [Bacteroidales bacterium]
MRFTLESLPPSLRRQAEKQLFGASSAPSDPPQPPKTTPPSDSAPPTDAKKRPFPRSDAKTRSTTRKKRSDAPDGGKPADSATSAVQCPLPDGEMTSHSPKSVEKPPFEDHRGVPNKTEARYNREILGGKGRYEPITLRMPGGNYTPDWMTIDDGVVTFHEVKGAFRFGSQSRAIFGFKSAAAAFPFWNFVWATLKKGGVWDVKRYDPHEEPKQ